MTGMEPDAELPLDQLCHPRAAPQGSESRRSILAVAAVECSALLSIGPIVIGIIAIAFKPPRSIELGAIGFSLSVVAAFIYALRSEPRRLMVHGFCRDEARTISRFLAMAIIPALVGGTVFETMLGGIFDLPAHSVPVWLRMPIFLSGLAAAFLLGATIFLFGAALLGYRLAERPAGRLDG